MNTPTDTEILQYLAQRIYFPNDCPEKGIFVGISEDIAPIGTFKVGGNELNELRNVMSKTMIKGIHY